MQKRRKVKVFLEKDGTRKEVDVLKRFESGRERVWFKEKTPKHTQHLPEGKVDESATEEAGEESVAEDDAVTVDDSSISEVDPEEMETEQKMWLSEKVTTLEKGKEEMSKTIQEMRAKIELQEKALTEMHQRHCAIEAAVAQIMEQVKRQNAFNEGVRASFTSLAEDVKKHNDNFHEVARIFKAHEEHIVKTGAASQEMAHYINALIKENENKNVWISSLMRESQEQTQVLRQHHLGLQVQAEVIKTVVNQQQQTATRQGPTVSDADDDQDRDRLDFLSGQNPDIGPPITVTGKTSKKHPRALRSKEGHKKN